MPWKPESLSHHSVCSCPELLAVEQHSKPFSTNLLFSTAGLQHPQTHLGEVSADLCLPLPHLGRVSSFSSSPWQLDLGGGGPRQFPAPEDSLTDVSAAMFPHGCALRRALNYYRSMRPPVNLNSLTPTKFYLDKSSLLSFSDPAECWIPKVFPSSVANVLDVFCTCIEMHSSILVLLSASLLVMQRKTKHETGFLLCYGVADTAWEPQFPFSEGRKE